MISTPVKFGPFLLANRFAVHPMEGWDGEPGTGKPTADVLRRWERIGSSGAALVWGVEALAIAPEFRANPRQLMAVRENTSALAEGLRRLRESRRSLSGSLDGFAVGAQLTCSGRYSSEFGPGRGRPIVHHHPEMDRRLGLGEKTPLLTDAEMEDIAARYAAAAQVVREAGFEFIDVKACHGYWLNETLAAKTRPGPYGGSFENRTRVFGLVLDAIRGKVGSGFPLGARLSAYDGIPFEEDPETRARGLKGRGRPSKYGLPYLWSWGADERDPLEPDTKELTALVRFLLSRGVAMFNLTAGVPYANPHLSRPTESPPVDGYQPPRDPLCEVAVHFRLAAAVKEACPEASIVGTGYSYLRQFKAHAAERQIASGKIDMVGVGRAVLSYPDEIRRILERGTASPGRGRVICTGDSSCTTGPRLGLKSGCIYDPQYASLSREIAKRLAGMGLKGK